MAGLLVVTILLAVMAVNGSKVPNGTFISEERRLYEYLMNGYNKAIRPVLNSSNTVNVGLRLSLLSIEDLNENQQVLTTHVWLVFGWTDEQLKWERNEYDVGNIRFEAEKLWTPDIALFNAQHDRYHYSLDTMVVVENTGSINWVPMIRLQSHCAINIRKFPFDEQECQLKFGSWTYPGDMVNLTLSDASGQIDTGSFTENAEWDVTKTAGVRNAVKYDCCPDTYIDVTYTISLRRRTDYLVHLLLAPSVVMTLLIPFIFLLPSDSAGKIMLGVGILVGLILMLVNFVPLVHGEVPLIVIYYLTSIVLVSLSLLFSTLILNTWNRSFRNKRMAGIIRKIMLGVFGRIVCVQRDNFVPDMPTMTMQKLEMMHNAPDAFTEERADDHSEDRINMMSTVTRLTVISEWRQLAVVLDRLFFIIFVVVTVIVSIAIAH